MYAAKPQESRSLQAAAFELPHAAKALCSLVALQEAPHYGRPIRRDPEPGSERLHMTTRGSIWSHFLSALQDFLDLSVGA